MKFSINPQKGDQIEFRESSVYYPELDLRFKSLPKDVQKYLEKEYEYRFGGNPLGGWSRFLDHVMHRTGEIN